MQKHSGKMAEITNNNAEKTPEKKLRKAGKPREIRICLLKTIQILQLYTQPLTLKELKIKLAENELNQDARTLREIINLINEMPPIGYTLQVKLTRSSTWNKHTPAFILSKIKYHNGTKKV